MCDGPTPSNPWEVAAGFIAAACVLGYRARRRMRPRAIATFLFVLPIACATTRATRPGESAMEAAERAYQAAMALYNDESWPEAQEAFRAIQRQYGTSRQATLAELRLADIEFRQERYTEALSAYRTWLRYHASHAEAPYARFMIARCHVAQMPEDWFLTPPQWERDLSAAHDADTALARFLRDHGDSPHAAEARRLHERVRETLVRHEIYVANFYGNRDHHAAAASRLRGVLSHYQGSSLEPLALLRLGETLLRLGRVPEARGAFAQLRERFPNTPEGEAAGGHLMRLGPGPSVPVQTDEPTLSEDTGATEDVVSTSQPTEPTPPRR